MLRRGQTLLELIIACGILVTTVTAAITLIIRTTTVGMASSDRVEATNYAREGIEVIRMIRDSNWLKIDMNLPDGQIEQPAGSGTFVNQPTLWDDNGMAPTYTQLGSAGNQLVVLTYNPTDGWQILSCGASCTSVQELIALKSINIGGTSYQYATQNCVGACQNTRYHRTITLAQAIDAGSGQTYINVTSKVTWVAGSNNREVILQTQLYNWK